MTMHGYPVRRRKPGPQPASANEPLETTPAAAVGFLPAPLVGRATQLDRPSSADDLAEARRAVLRRTFDNPTAPVPASAPREVLRRQILDPEAEEDVFDAAEGKRDAEVQDLSLDHHVSGHDHSALEQFLGGRQAKGPQARPMAELRATRKTADHRIRKSVRSGVDSARAQKAVTKGADRPGLEQLLGKKAERGPDFDTAKHLKSERRERRNKRRAEARQSHNTELAARDRAAGLQIQQAKNAVQSKSTSMSKVLKHGRAALRAGLETAEMAQFVAAYDAKNWTEALAALGQVESASATALSNAHSRLTARSRGAEK